MSDSRVKVIIDNMSDIIIHHGGLLAAEVYAPRHDVDQSDDIVKYEKEFIKEMRELRNKFENLILGIDGHV